MPDVPAPEQHEIDFLLETVSTALERPLALADVRGTFAGLRPLIAPPKSAGEDGATADISRRHHVAVSAHGIVNVLGGIPPLVESLQLQTKIMPQGSEWAVIGISHGAWRMLGTALVLGGNVRCGLEDHLYLPSGEMAKSNGELVEVEWEGGRGWMRQCSGWARHRWPPCC